MNILTITIWFISGISAMIIPDTRVRHIYRGPSKAHATYYHKPWPLVTPQTNNRGKVTKTQALANIVDSPTKRVPSRISHLSVPPIAYQSMEANPVGDLRFWKDNPPVRVSAFPVISAVINLIISKTYHTVSFSHLLVDVILFRRNRIATVEEATQHYFNRNVEFIISAIETEEKPNIEGSLKMMDVFDIRPDELFEIIKSRGILASSYGHWSNPYQRLKEHSQTRLDTIEMVKAGQYSENEFYSAINEKLVYPLYEVSRTDNIYNAWQRVYWQERFAGISLTRKLYDAAEVDIFDMIEYLKNGPVIFQFLTGKLRYLELQSIQVLCVGFDGARNFQILDAAIDSTVLVSSATSFDALQYFYIWE